MAKATTLKDVIYALQFGGEQLVGDSSYGYGVTRWTLSKSKGRVDTHTVEQLRANPQFTLLITEGSVSRYGWKEVA